MQRWECGVRPRPTPHSAAFLCLHNHSEGRWGPGVWGLVWGFRVNPCLRLWSFLPPVTAQWQALPQTPHQVGSFLREGGGQSGPLWPQELMANLGGGVGADPATAESTRKDQLSARVQRGRRERPPPGGAKVLRCWRSPAEAHEMARPAEPLQLSDNPSL